MDDLRWKAYTTAAIIFAIDRATKWVVDTRVSFLDTYRVIPGFFDIVHSQNRGVAFGLFNESTWEWRTSLLVVTALAAVVVVTVMLWNARRLDRFAFWGLSLILGGAAGNLFDRMMWGHVTDFLVFYFRDYQWPAFNMADSAIVVGSGLLMIDLLRSKRTANVS